MWGGLVDYYHYTNDSTYNKITTQALLSQTGPNNDYMVPAQADDEGNDDQAFWGFALMSAAEKNYPAPPSGTPSWVQLTANLWNTQVARWNTTQCNGGLKWQIFSFNKGFDYKSSVSNGAFFQLAARLARYTGNQTYVDWVNKSWDWSTGVGFVDQHYNVYDGADDTVNCTQVDQIQFTYSLGIYLYGAAVMYNYTDGSSLWRERTVGLLNASTVFFSPYSNATDIMYESPCEQQSVCNTDEQSFKAYLARFMWATTQMAPFTTANITAALQASAQGAAASCSGGEDKVTCGSRWYTDSWDGELGVGQQLAALEVMQGLLINTTTPPLTSDEVRLMQASPRPTTTPLPTSTKKSGATSAPSIAAGGLLGAGIAIGMAMVT